MANKSKNTSWTPVIIVALILIFIGVIYFSGNSNNKNSDYDKGYYGNDYVESNNLVSDEFSGNSNNKNSDYDSDTGYVESNNLQTITISGIDKNQDVLYDVPIKLVISGIRNTIIVKRDTQVNEMVISGIDITIYLPVGSNPKVTDSGIRTKISYY